MFEVKPNVRIDSDGTVNGTKVFFIRSDGVEEEIKFVTGIKWSLMMEDRYASADISLLASGNVDAEMVALDARVKVQNPKGNDD